MSRVGTLFGLVFALCAANALAATGPATPASAELQARWQAILSRQDSVRVVHVRKLRRPVPFKTKKPCELRTEQAHGDQRLGGPDARRVTGWLARELGRPNSTPCGGSDCAVDSTVLSEQILFRFVDAGDTLSISLQPGRSVLSVRDQEHRSWCTRPGTRSRALLETLAELMPDDARLTAMPLCPESTAVAIAKDSDDEVDRSLWVDQLPSITKRKKPNYPAVGLANQLEAKIEVLALVGTDGRVKGTALTNTSFELQSFQESAVAAVEGYEFEPAQSKGQPIAVWVAVPIRFKLQ